MKASPLTALMVIVWTLAWLALAAFAAGGIAAFLAGYNSYRARTWRLLPYIY